VAKNVASFENISSHLNVNKLLTNAKNWQKIGVFRPFLGKNQGFL
jgi:hypothetical protein